MNSDAAGRSTAWQEKLTRNQIVIIDGATGTELQRRGVSMDEVAWSGAAVLGYPRKVRAVHEDYIRAGAEVIITNTFGSTRQMLGPAGLGEHVEKVNRQGVELAVEARDSVADQAVAVAGSLSAMPPAFDRAAYFSPQEELESYREAIGIMVAAGADLIALEMMEDTDHAVRAMQAAVESELPVWLGVSCKQTEQGELVGFEEIGLGDLLDALLPMGPALVNIMHSSVHVVPAALDLVRERWDGPLGVTRSPVTSRNRPGISRT